MSSSKKHLLGGTAKPRGTAPGTMHIDRRVDQVLALGVGGADDDLLTTAQVAAWFGVSVAWLEIARLKGHGPEFETMGPRCIRYRRGQCREWLRSRACVTTDQGRRMHADDRRMAKSVLRRRRAKAASVAPTEGEATR
jgi:hypothetical protein